MIISSLRMSSNITQVFVNRVMEKKVENVVEKVVKKITHYRFNNPHWSIKELF